MDIKEIQLWIDMSDEIGDATDANIGRFALLRDRQAKEKEADNEVLRAKLADCQVVIRSRGHAEHCPTNKCANCGWGTTWHGRADISLPRDCVVFIPLPCSDACGHDRTTGEKS